ncbi:MAG: hypothetical protein WBX15_02475 [Thermoanaerobaculia bacterium]
MRQRFSILAAGFLFVLLTAGCSSLGSLGDLGTILGSTGPQNQSTIQGTVTAVNPTAQRIDLDVSTVNNLRNAQPGSSIYWDSNTTVVYQGKTYSPTDLERGDQISVTGSNSSGKWVADQITVTRDISG